MMTPPVILTKAILRSAVIGLKCRRSLEIDCFTIYRGYKGNFSVAHIDSNGPMVDISGTANMVIYWLIQAMALTE